MIIEATSAWSETWISGTHAVAIAIDDVQFCRAYGHETNGQETPVMVSRDTYLRVAAYRNNGTRAVLKVVRDFDFLAVATPLIVEALARGNGPDHAASRVAHALQTGGFARAVGLTDTAHGEHHPLADAVTGIKSFVDYIDSLDLQKDEASA